MSFNNLNMSLKQDNVETTPFGLYSYEFLWFGVLQFDNVFGLSDSAPSSSQSRVVGSSSATVATAFWDYWYDYRYLCCIPIWISIGICGIVVNRAQKRPSIVSIALCCMFLPSFFFQSFQNIFFTASLFWTVLLILLFAKMAFPDVKLEQMKTGREQGYV